MDIFLNANNPNSIWPAKYRADRVLEQRPRTAGRELSEGLWLFVTKPLRIYYEINEDKKIVTVTFVDII